jgi:hypothetical protein
MRVLRTIRVLGAMRVLRAIRVLRTIGNLRASRETSTAGATRTTGEAKALECEGYIASVEYIGQALALHNGLAIEGQEGDRLARAVIVVPDGDAGAQKGVLGVGVCLEGVVVDAPVAVDDRLVASHWSRNRTGRELGLAKGQGANGAGFPRLELNAGDGESCICGQHEQRR